MLMEQIYVTWIGSDKNNRKMTSAGNFFFLENCGLIVFIKGTRLSRFRNFDMSEIYTRAQNLKNITTSTE